MLKHTDKFADTTVSKLNTDVLDDALRSLHISGSVLLREAYSPPCAISIPRSENLGKLLGAKEGTRVVAFHLVEFGHCEIKPESGNATTLTAGEMVICFGGEAHQLSQGKTKQIQPIEELLAGGVNTQRPTKAGTAPGVSLLCGVFMLNHTAFNPLFAALPPVMQVSLTRMGELHNLSGVAHIMANEISRTTLGSGFIVERLLEVLCAEAVRAYIEAAPRHETGWFRGIKDPIIGRALQAIHSNPAENWTVQRLAQKVAMSPSRFAARLSESLEDSPMAYVAKWRMNIACRKLSASSIRVEQLAVEIGYESVAAFNRAFKKHLGLPPAAWRARENASRQR
jgi:AraC-like DNA-binding protein